VLAAERHEKKIADMVAYGERLAVAKSTECPYVLIEYGMAQGPPLSLAHTGKMKREKWLWKTQVGIRAASGLCEKMRLLRQEIECQRSGYLNTGQNLVQLYRLKISKIDKQ